MVLREIPGNFRAITAQSPQLTPMTLNNMRTYSQPRSGRAKDAEGAMEKEATAPGRKLRGRQSACLRYRRNARSL